MTTAVAEILEHLVAIPSVVGRPNGEIVARVRAAIEAHGGRVTVVPGPEGDRANLFATFGPKDVPGLVLSGHMDVVPADEPNWTSDPFVLRRDGEVGEIAELGSVLFWVGEPKPLIVTADVNEEDIPRVTVGQKALLKSDAFPGRSLDAAVDSITPKGDPVTKTYRVRLRLPDDTPLMIGMSTDVNIIVRVSHAALLVPSVAVNGTKVVVAENGKARLREIKAGVRGTAAVEVLSGLDEAARIISPYPADLPAGARVTISHDRKP